MPSPKRKKRRAKSIPTEGQINVFVEDLVNADVDYNPFEYIGTSYEEIKELVRKDELRMSKNAQSVLRLIEQAGHMANTSFINNLKNSIGKFDGPITTASTSKIMNW